MSTALAAQVSEIADRLERDGDEHGAVAKLREAAAALTREQREGVVTFAVDGVRFDVPTSIAEKVAAKLAPADNLPQPQQEAQGAVAWKDRARDMLNRLNTMQPPNVVLQQVTMLGEARSIIEAALASTQPAPVDVRAAEVTRAILDEGGWTGEPDELHVIVERALLDGQANAASK